MKFTPTKIPEVILIEPTLFQDNRGYFFETRHEKKFAENNIPYHFVQDNASHSTQGVLRGLHFQSQNAQGKLVRATQGEVFDVAVDLRRDSPTFRQWVSAILSAKNHHQLWVPPGFAHGFYVLSATADVIYSCTDFYTPQYEHTLIWNDPDINVIWPLINGQQPIVAAKDAAGKLFQEI